MQKKKTKKTTQPKNGKELFVRGALQLYDQCIHVGIDPNKPPAKTEPWFGNFLNRMTSIHEQSTAYCRRFHLDRRSDLTEGELRADAFLTSAIHDWKQAKVIYSFAPDFFSILGQTEDSPIYRSVLERLPHHSFFLYVPEGDALGYIVSLEFPEGGGNVFLACGQIKVLPKSDFWIAVDGTQYHNFVDGEGLMESFNKADGRENAAGLHSDVLRKVVMACYYLAAKNAELHELKPSKATKPRRADGRPVAIKDVQAGPVIHYGRPVGLKRNDGKQGDTEQKSPTEAQEAAQNSAHTAARPPRPHMRRAHWHHYWTGEGRTTLEVRWIEPVFVRGKGESGAVVHVVH